MRILHISTRLILGGSQENTVLSCEGQARLGHEVHLAFGPIYGPEGSLLERVTAFRTTDGRSITTHVVPNLVRELSPVADFRCERELRALIGRLRPDIVHTHSSKAGILGRAAAWAVNRTNARASAGASDAPTLTPNTAQAPMGILHTIHGPPFMPLEGSAISRAKTRLKNWIYQTAERYAARRCHLILAVADAMTAQFIARRIGTPSQYATVRSGMEIEPFVHAAPGESRAQIRTWLGLAPDDVVIGTVARLAEHKGHDDLLDALATDLKTHPTWRLLWVGDGWWRERLLGRARALSIAVHEHDRGAPDPSGPKPQLILTGLVPPTRVPALIRAMDVLAHPSYREGLPRTVPQALLSGVCPVAYDVDGTGEACRDMQTGRLVPLADRAKLRDAVVWLAENPEHRHRLAERGRVECINAFSTETMVAELEKAYQRALALAGRTTA